MGITLQSVKDLSAILREWLIIATLVLIALFPERVGLWLARHGGTDLTIAGLHVSLAQYRQQIDALNAVNKAAQTAQQPEIRSDLQNVGKALETSLTEQARAIVKLDPSALPREGWIYLGTVSAERSRWRDGTSSTTLAPWPITVGQVVNLVTDVNLRAASSSDDRPRAPILTILPYGTRVRVLELDGARRVPDGDPAAPGWRVWARVGVVGT